MSKATVRLIVRPRWWLGFYLSGVKFTSMVTGLEPDMDKVGAVIERGLVIKIEPNER